MKQFYIQSGIMICEWQSFEQSILFGKHGFKFTPEQWKNRKIGRTKLRDEERIAMIHVLELIRKDNRKKEDHDTTRFAKEN